MEITKKMLMIDVININKKIEHANDYHNDGTFHDIFWHLTSVFDPILKKTLKPYNIYHDVINNYHPRSYDLEVSEFWASGDYQLYFVPQNSLLCQALMQKAGSIKSLDEAGNDKFHNNYLPHFNQRKLSGFFFALPCNEKPLNSSQDLINWLNHNITASKISE